MAEDLNQHKLRAFLAVAEELSFRRAAERLGLDQGAISRHVQDLERLLKANLLIRNRRSVELTAAGKTLVDYGWRILELAQDAFLLVRAVSDEMNGNQVKTGEGEEA